MNWVSNIVSLFRGGRKILNGGSSVFSGGWGDFVSRPFSDAIYYNVTGLLTCITRDVTWRFDGSNSGVESAFVRFYNAYSEFVMSMLFEHGYVVIKHTSEGDGSSSWHEFSIAQSSEYNKSSIDGFNVFKSLYPDQFEIYVMRTPIYQVSGKSDKEMLSPFLEYLDNTLNASNTVSSRMGAMVVCSPKNLTNSPMSIVLDDDEKQEIEKQMRTEYGALSNQSQVMVLPREMSWQVISLAQLDLKVQDKTKIAICAIADRFGVPANQISIIDANSSKTLSNGTELREGDLNKYKSFERYLDATFVQLARDCGLKPGMNETTQGESVGSYYVIYNKPKQADEKV